MTASVLDSVTHTAVPLSYLLILGTGVFVIGFLGILLNRRNLILMLMSIELMLLAVNINFVAFSNELKDLAGQIFSLFVLTVAAAEVSIGLAILVVYFRQRHSIRVDDLSQMKG